MNTILCMILGILGLLVVGVGLLAYLFVMMFCFGAGLAIVGIGIETFLGWIFAGKNRHQYNGEISLKWFLICVIYGIVGAIGISGIIWQTLKLAIIAIVAFAVFSAFVYFCVGKTQKGGFHSPNATRRTRKRMRRVVSR